MTGELANRWCVAAIAERQSQTFSGNLTGELGNPDRDKGEPGAGAHPARRAEGASSLRINGMIAHARLDDALQEVLDTGVAGMDRDLMASLEAHHNYFDFAVLMQDLRLRPIV